MTLFDLLHDAAARIVRAQEALEVGERELAWELLRDLEADLIGSLARCEEQVA